MPHILVLCAHPDLRLSRVNHRLLEAAQALQRDPPPGLTLELRDLYSLYPDYVLDVQEEQAAAERADLIVWQHPIYWYSMPPLMKLWLDEVLAHGWAYGHDGQALRGAAVVQLLGQCQEVAQVAELQRAGRPGVDRHGESWKSFLELDTNRSRGNTGRHTRPAHSLPRRTQDQRTPPWPPRQAFTGTTRCC